LLLLIRAICLLLQNTSHPPKLLVLRAEPIRQAQAPGLRPSKLRYDPVMLELSRARACVWLLDELHSGVLSRFPSVPRPGDDRDEPLARIQSMTLENLPSAIRGAEEAFAEQWSQPKSEEAA
jgi:hypothetical protein